MLADLVLSAAALQHSAIAVIPPGDGWLHHHLPTDQIRELAPSPRAVSGPVDLDYLRALRRIVSAERPTLLHAHSFNTAFYGALAVLGTHTKLVATFHGVMEIDRRTWRDRAKWLAMHRATKLVCVSRSLETLATSVRGFPRHRACTIYNGIDLTRFSPSPSPVLRARLGLSSSEVLIGAVGNVRAPKGYPILLRAIAQLRALGLQVHLAIAGDDTGLLADELRALRTQLGLDAHVTFVGFIGDVPSFLNGLDLFVLSSLSEGFSLATVQALATGLPVVATRSGGPEEIVEAGVSGVLVETESVGALVEGLSALIRSAEDRQSLASAGRARALAHFSLDAMLMSYRELYHEVIAS